MCRVHVTTVAFALAVVAALLPANASAGSSLYELIPTVSVMPAGIGAQSGPALGVGPVRVAPALQTDGSHFWRSSAMLDTGSSWFAQLEWGRSAQQSGLAAPSEGGDQVGFGGGWRFGDRQSLSLQLIRDKRRPGLGLALGYEWPAYFVRLSVDPRLSIVPQDTLRFSAGVRF